MADEKFTLADQLNEALQKELKSVKKEAQQREKKQLERERERKRKEREEREKNKTFEELLAEYDGPIQKYE
ncbi:DUF3886 domain-containing protein [Savagea faecisuis]|mgnify:CR=1 FL=1|uniref:DUF3886 domain-containing protein n=1 Tax=Savagea faecisuis TaxID=1274803 RepID=A0ABW3GW78_9BACL